MQWYNVTSPKERQWCHAVHVSTNRKHSTGGIAHWDEPQPASASQTSDGWMGHDVRSILLAIIAIRE